MLISDDHHEVTGKTTKHVDLDLENNITIREIDVRAELSDRIPR